MCENLGMDRVLFSSLTLIRAVIILVIIEWIGVPQAAAVNDGNDLVFSKEEEDLLNQLKQHPDVVHLMTEDLMKANFYLVRFLRAANLDIDDSVDMIFETMAWRKENNISEILSEDWSDMLSQFPIDFSSRDLLNRPVVQVLAEDWNVREGVYYDRFERYSLYIMERTAAEVLKARGEGYTNVTRVFGLLDAKGGELSIHFCLYCIAFAASWLSKYRHHYPNTVDELFVINLPPLISASRNVLSPFMTAEMDKVIRTFSAINNNEVVAYLDKIVPRDRRLPQFGGTKPFDHSGWSYSAVKSRTPELSFSGARGVFLEYAIITILVLVIITICLCCLKCVISKCNGKYEKCRQNEVRRFV